jgi:deoxyribose-phosphate aldolase
LRGVKLSGGIRTSEDLEALLSAVTEEGLSVTDDQYLRIGASSLLDSLLSE